MSEPTHKPCFFIGSSRRDIRKFPRKVAKEVGQALQVAQYGGKADQAKPWMGLGSGVLEIVEDYDGDTYRASRPVKFGPRRRSDWTHSRAAT